jgi:hypothetical protein
MKILSIASYALMIFFYVAVLPFAFVVSCFKLALERTDQWLIAVLNNHLERRKK